MQSPEFPPFVRSLPEADLPIEGVRGWLLRSDVGLVLFLEATEEVDLPLHTHGDQWGIVVDGSMELTIGDEARTCRRGDSYVIPSGTPHGALLHAGLRLVDFFTDPDRYHPRA